MKNRGTGLFAGYVAALLATLAVASTALAKGTAYVVGNQNELGALPIAADGRLSAGNSAPTGMFTPRALAITPNARYLYMTSVNSRVIGFDITGATPTQVPNSPFNVTDTDGHGIATTPDGQRLYSVNKNGGAGSVSIFSINGNGSLTKVGGNVVLGFDSQGIAVAPNGASLYITDDTADTVHAYAIAADGAISEIGTARAAGAGAKGVAVSPDGRFVLTGATGGQISAFPVQGDGSLGAAVSTVNTAKVLQTVAVSQDGRFFYAAEFGAPGAIWAYAVGTGGALTPVPNQPFTAFDFPYGLDAAPGARSVYSASFDAAADVKADGYSSAGDGALSPLPGSPYQTQVIGAEFQSIAVTPNQGPTATFMVAPGGTRGGGIPATFDATGSSDSDGGSVTRYDWDFGDGTTLPDGGPTPSHVYAQPGDYTVTLTVTDDQGCSTNVVFTGQTVDCNGGSAARSQQAITVAPGDPELKLSGKRKQELSKSVLVKARTVVDSEAVAKGKLSISSGKGSKRALASYKLKKKRKSLEAGEKTKLKPKLSKKALKKAKRALGDGGKVKAKVTVKATTSGDASDKAKLKVKLTR